MSQSSVDVPEIIDEESVSDETTGLLLQMRSAVASMQSDLVDVNTCCRRLMQDELVDPEKALDKIENIIGELAGDLDRLQLLHQLYRAFA